MVSNHSFCLMPINFSSIFAGVVHVCVPPKRERYLVFFSFVCFNQLNYAQVEKEMEVFNGHATKSSPVFFKLLALLE